MTYTIRTIARKPTDGLLDDVSVARRRPGWLVLVGIRYDASGDRLADALVVTAELTAAERG